MRHGPIEEPWPNKPYGCKSFVLSVGIKGDVEDYWIVCRPENARLIQASPKLLATVTKWYDWASEHPYSNPPPDGLFEETETLIDEIEGESDGNEKA